MNKNDFIIAYLKKMDYISAKNFALKFNIYFRFKKHSYHNNWRQKKKWMIHERIMNIKMQ